jgi:hypothetical protein
VSIDRSCKWSYHMLQEACINKKNMLKDSTCKESFIWHVMSCSLVGYQRFGRMYCHLLQAWNVSQTTRRREQIPRILLLLNLILDLKMEAVCSSRTSMNSNRTTRYYVSGISTLHCHCRKNLQSRTLEISSLIQYLVYIYNVKLRIWELLFVQDEQYGSLGAFNFSPEPHESKKEYLYFKINLDFFNPKH